MDLYGCYVDEFLGWISIVVLKINFLVCGDGGEDCWVYLCLLFFGWWYDYVSIVYIVWNIDSFFRWVDCYGVVFFCESVYWCKFCSLCWCDLG